jgi:hypothetical protein
MGSTADRPGRDACAASSTPSSSASSDDLALVDDESHLGVYGSLQV